MFKELQQQRKKKQKKRAEERVIALQKQRAASTPHNLTPMKEGQRQTSLYTALDDSVGQGSVLRSDSLEMGNAGNDSATSLPSRAGQHPIHPEDGDIGNEDIGVSDGGTADDNKQSIGSENKRRRTGRRSGSGRRMNVLVVEGKGKGNSLVKEMDSDTSEAIQSIKNFAKSFSLGHEPTLFGKGMARAKEYFGVETLARVGEGVPLLDSVLESRFVNEIACSRRRARSHTGASPSESVKVNLLRSLGSLASPSLWQKVPETSNRKGHKQPQRYKQLHARGKKANVSKCIYHIGIKLPDTLQKCLPPTLKTPFLSHFRFLHRRGDRRVIHSARGFQTKPKTALQLVAEREEAKARARVEKQREKEDGKGGHRQLSLQLRLKLGRACGGNKAETGRSGKSANSGLWKKLAASASPEPPTSDAIMHFHKDYLRHFLSLPPELRVLEKRRIARLKERKRTFQLRLKRFEQYRTQHMNETRAKDEDEHLTSMKEVQRKDEHRLAVEKAKKMELERQRKQRRAKSVGLCSFQRFKRNARKIMVKRSIIGLLKGSQASTDAGTEIKKEADPSLCTKGADNSNLKVKTTASNGEEGGGDVNEELGKGTGESTENKRKSVSFGSRPDVNGKEGHVPRNGQDRTKMLQRSVDEAGARATVKVSPMNGNESDGAGVDLSSSDEDDSLDEFSLTKKQSADEFEEDSIDSDSDVDMCDDIVHFKQFELDQLSLDIVKYVNILLRKFHDPFMWQGQPYGLIYNSCN